MPPNNFAKLDIARKELLDLGLRNSLINYQARAKKVEVVDELSREVYRLLVIDGKTFTFAPLPEKMLEEDNGELLELLANEEPDWNRLFSEDVKEEMVNGVASRHMDTRLQTRLSSTSLHARLLGIHNDARTYIEEQGVNILYLALGFLHWFEADSSTKERRAPLVLIPVELGRASAKERFRLSYNGDDIGDNLSLLEKLKAEFAIKLPITEGVEDLDINRYFDEVSDRIAGQSRWFVQPNEIVLGFFSFGKFLMYKDLATDTWPEQRSPREHLILRALLEEGFREPAAQVPDDAHIDELISPEQVRQVVDADSSQTLAIIDVNAGRNMVIQGPPGTGKSQTITNIIAESIGMGKKVLFVSEKMAALEVVKRRLDRIGLGDAVLELHSHKTNKHTVLKELERTLNLGRPVLGRVDDDIQAFTVMRDRLNAYCEAINRPILESGISPVEAIGGYMQLGADAISLPRMDFSAMRDWNNAQLKAQRLRVEELQRRIQAMGIPRKNPFWGTSRTVLLPTDEVRARNLITQALSHTESVWEKGKALALQLGLTEPETAAKAAVLCRAAMRAMEAPHLSGVRLRSGEWQVRRDDLRRVITAGRRIAELRGRFESVLIPDAWEQDLLTERQHFVAYGGKWWRFLSGDYRRSRARLAGLSTQPLPKHVKGCLAMIDAILEERKERQIYREHQTLGEGLFGAQWQKERSDWDVLASVLDWVIQLYQDVGDGRLPQGLIDVLAGSPNLLGVKHQVAAIVQELRAHRELMQQLEQLLEFSLPSAEESIDSTTLERRTFSAQISILSEWRDNLRVLNGLVSYNALAAEFRESGLGFVLDLAEGWEEAPEKLLSTFDATWLGGLVETAFSERRELQQFDRVSHEYAREKFRELDHLLLQHNRARLASKHWSEIPNLAQGGELNIIHREVNKRRRHLPIRRLIGEAGRAIQAIKPVFMMSPMSIASFLPPGQIDFHLVLFDEASQVKPVDAFGAILRGEQTVVVGDSRQLPPTNFFESLNGGDQDDGEEIENVPAQLESILGLFDAQGAPARMLRWHYRSKHESLIAVSNHEFYDNKLVLFPSPGATPSAKGLVFHHLPDTAYDRGKTRTNPHEAKAVATRIIQHAREHPELSLGVAAFSTAQRDAIEFQLELLRRRDESCEDFFNAHPEEPFFVKNLENVQGDERDVILISIGYGKTQEGYMGMSFGPLNQDGGERRLNVLISRAKRSCEVFANFTAEDLDLRRSGARGVAALKTFLTYARDRVLNIGHETGQASDSPFEDAVIAGLRQAGHEVEPQVGAGGFRIDIGVRDPYKPGRYLLGIECDGAAYHSARSARDRDRLREEVLKGLGWRIHRIWSTDWFRNPAEELLRVIEAIEKARVYWAGFDDGKPPEASYLSHAQPLGIDRSEETPQRVPISLTKEYEAAHLSIHLRGVELHELPAVDLAGYVVEAVKVESPVHTELVIQRITTGAGLKRAGARIRQVVEKAIKLAASQNKIRIRGNFLWSIDMDKVPIRDRSAWSSQEKKLELVAPEELHVAIEAAIASAFSCTHSDAISNALGLLGFKRVTSSAESVARQALDFLIRNGRVVEQDSVLCVPTEV